MSSLLRGTTCVLALCLVAGACRPGTDDPAGGQRPASTAAAGESLSSPRVVILGDSLTSGYGLARDEAFPAILQTLLEQQGRRYEVVNAGVSGDTSAGGLRRLDWVLSGDVRILVVALGGNDGLRGLAADEMKRNLAEIIHRARARDIEVLLAGMEAPPNLGSRYTTAFRQAFADLAREEGVTFLPFLLDGVAGEPSLNQADGIHPNAEGARAVAERVLAALEPVLDDVTRAGGRATADGGERAAPAALEAATGR